MYYARVDKSNKCYAIFGTNKKETASDLIELTEDINVIGKTWNGKTWEGETAIPLEPEPATTQLDRIEANLDYIVMMSE